jgi:hypothetical protein
MSTVVDRSARFRLMGILNVTPDSFSDGGLFLETDAAVEHGLSLIAQGADIVDVGGESTRPGAEPVSAGDELRRVLGVVEGLASAVKGMPARPPARPTAQISIDTSKAAVAEQDHNVVASVRVSDDLYVVLAPHPDPALDRSTEFLDSGVAGSVGAEAWHLHPCDAGIERSRSSGPVVPESSVNGFANHLHVLPRHRLLRQPGGFEGFGTVQVALGTQQLPVPNRPDRRPLDV